MKQRLGFLGLGIMGSGMVQNLCQAGYEVAIWNRSAEKAVPFEKMGATRYNDPGKVAENCDILLLCVTDESVVSEVLFADKTGAMTATNPPKIVVDLSTINPTVAIEYAKRLLESDCNYLDAPVSGGDVGARNGTLTIMVGGDKKSFEAVLPVLETLGKNIVHTGAVGNGQKTKCINQIAVAVSVAAMSESLFLAEQTGLDLPTTLKAISGGAAGSWSLSNYAPRILENDLAPGFRARDMVKDLLYAAELAAASGSELPVAALVQALYYELVESDPRSELGNHALIERYRK